jgi:hypothetical protein
MLRRNSAVSVALAAGGALLLSLALVGSAAKRAQGEPPAGIPPTQLVVGDAELVEGNLVVSWARVQAGEALTVEKVPHRPALPVSGFSTLWRYPLMGSTCLEIFHVVSLLV